MACARCWHSVVDEPEAPATKSELRVRWLVLVVLCSGLFGSYYVFDIPSATENAQQSYWNVGNNTAASDQFNSNFNLLYSVYSFPNVILPFFGGYISDVMGVRLMGVVFMFLITAGQVVTALGASMEDQQSAWYVMWAGRTLFGLGGESLSVVQSAFVARYFQGKELALALGVNLALARVGSVINDVVSAVIANNAAFYWSYWAGAAVCGASLLAMVAAYYVDLAADNRLRAVKGLPPLAGQGLLRRLVGLFCGCCWRRRQPQRRGSSGRPSGDEDDEVALAALGGKGADGEGEGPTEEIHMSAVLRFPLTFWILCGSCLTVYICVLTFNNNAAAFIAQKYLADAPLSQLTDDQKNPMFLTANSIMLTTYLVSGFLTPFLGGVIDNVGLRAIFCAVAAVIITGLHAVMALTTLYPVAPLVLLGVCYSIYAAALWPSIALVIDPANQATAYGVVTALQNLGLAVSPLVVAQFQPSASCATLADCVAAWNRVEYFFVACGGAGVVFGVLLNAADGAAKGGAILNAGRVGCCRPKAAGAAGGGKRGAALDALLLEGEY